MEKNIHDFDVALQPITTLNPVEGGDDTIVGRKAVIRQGARVQDRRDNGDSAWR